MFQTSDDVLNWLADKSGDGLFYLNILNFYWGSLNQEICIRIYQELARQLKPYPEVVRLLLQQDNWRPVLVGNAVAILQRNSDFDVDMLTRLERCWVGPQLAAGMAILARPESIARYEAKFEELLRREEYDYGSASGKYFMSLYTCLKLLDRPIAVEFGASDLYQVITLQANPLPKLSDWKYPRYRDNLSWVGVAEFHWKFWRQISPI